MPVNFRLGRVVATPGALELLSLSGYTPASLISRHVQGDWGDLGEEDKATNDRAVREGTRILSSYRINTTDKIWIITEADQSSTCILLPEEY